MIRFYIKSTLRLIERNKALSAIKIAGLAMGLGTFLLTSLFVVHELSYDTVHPQAERIYRYVHRVNTPEGLQSFAFTSATIGPALKERFPEVETYTRVHTNPVTVRNPTKDVGFNEEAFGFVDANFFEFFRFPIVGTSRISHLLTEPYTVVITPEIALRYFGEENPVGKSLIINSRMNFVVTGVLQQNLNRTHFKHDFFASFSTLEAIKNDPVLSAQIPASLSIEAKGYAAFYTYLRLSNQYSPETLTAKFPAFIEEFRGKGKSERLKPTLQSLTSIHLNSHFLYEIDQNGSLQSVIVFFAIGISILLIASINYINLSTAEFINRARGIGLKQILGVRRGALFASYLVESALMSLLAVWLGALIAFLMLPYFNELVHRTIELEGRYFFPLVAATWFVATLVSGVYPSLAISRIGTLQAFRGASPSGVGFFTMRNGLVFFQVLVSFCLLSVAFLIFQQLSFLLTKDLGFESGRLIVVNTNGTTAASRDSFKAAMLRKSGITGVAGCSQPPPLPLATLGLTFAEHAGDEERRVGVYQSYVDADYLKTLGIHLTAGRNFDSDSPADSLHYIIINQTAADILADSSGRILAKEVEVPDLFGSGAKNKKAVIGVTNDFHFESLHKTVEPLVLEYNPNRVNCLLVRFEADGNNDITAFLENEWKQINPSLPFDYYFLDQGLAKWYDGEQRLKGTVFFFSCLAIGLAALGLFGTTLFTVQQRTREIGIRKALGSAKSDLFLLLIKPVSILILASCIVGVPVAYLASGRWLSQFPYRVSIDPWWFVEAFLIILVLVIASLIYHFVKIARINPADVLREH